MDELVTTIIYGEGGKSGGGSGAVEAENTLRSSAVARIVEVISEGPIEGIAGGPAGIYINDTPLFNTDGTTNFARATWDYRVGLPDQDYMPGFNAIEGEFSVNTVVSIATNNIIRTTSAANIDAVSVTMLLPSGLSEQDTSNGNLNGSEVTFKIYTKLGAGTYALYGTYTIKGKTVNPYEASYRINAPGAGTWSIKVERITADPTASQHTQTTWSRMTEIREIQVSYPDAAVVGIAIDAETVGNTIPKRGYLVKGVLIKIPSNYNPVTRVYTGAWNGLFTTATIAVDNPVWALYDIMTNARYGAGIDPADIDKYSFYDAAVYCDAFIDNGASGTEPRYSFNARIADRPDMLKLMKAVCGSMNANLIFWGGKWTLIQDRPTSVSKLITKANVVDGLFTYKSSGLFERHTAINVSFNDRNDRYLERVVTVEDAAGMDRYGYNSTDIAAFGATTEGQAIRLGRWVLDSELHQSEICEFQMSLNGFDLTPGDIVSVYDEDSSGAGKVVSYAAASTSVVLDRAVVVTSGATITALLADGVTLQTRTISGTGTLSTLTIASAFSTALFANADYVITGTVSPRPFKIVDVNVPEANLVNVKAVFFDAGKFARVETGVVLPDSVFSNPLSTVVPPPTSIVFAEEGIVLPSGLPRRFLRVTWTAPAGNTPIKGYNVTWARNNANRVNIPVDTNMCLVPADEDGTYAVSVFSRDYNGNVSGRSLNGSYVFGSGSLTVDPSGFGAPINFVAIDSNGTTWSQNDLVVRWADNTTNTRPAASYKLEIYTTADVLLRTETIPSGTRQFNYTLALNTTDGSGTPRVSLKMKCYGCDALGAYSNPVTVTFTNPAPATITGFTATGMYKAAALAWTANSEADLQGYYVWRGTSSGFTPSASNLVYTGFGTTFLDGVLADATTYYYKIAGYDRFTKSDSGTGLNIATTSTASTGVPGVPGGSSLPGSGTEGDLFFNTTDGKLYRYHSGAWTIATDGADILANSITAGKLTAYSVATNNIQTGAITAGSGIIADLAVTTLKVADNAITVPFGKFQPSTEYMWTTDQGLIAGSINVPYACKVIITISGCFRAPVVATWNVDQVEYTTYPYALRLMRDNTTQVYSTGAVVGAGTYLQPFSATFVDTVAAGDHYYWWGATVGNTGAGYSYTGSTRGFYNNLSITLVGAMK